MMFLPLNLYIQNFFKATTLFQHPFEKLVQQFNPNCLIADSFFPWANSTAQKFQIPCFTFHGCSYFSQCITSNLVQYKPYNNVMLDDEEFIVPDLPHNVKLTRSVLTPIEKQECPSWLAELFNQVRESQKTCDGVIMNSFYELEPDYADYYENSLKMKHWHIGPLSLYLKENNTNNASLKGKETSCIDVSECMKWVEQKEANSVIYVCFGSMASKSNTQLHELALALECSGCNFILAVRKGNKEWMPHGFESRIKEQGFIISGWAPQGLILQHKSVGVFMTHCGWNSILEGVTAGLPMVTWPSHAEQFHNEKLITNVLKIGVPVGAKKWMTRLGGDDIDSEALVNKEDIIKGIKVVMGSQEGQEMRERAKCLAEMAKRAVVEGGSSYSDVDNLIEQLNSVYGGVSSSGSHSSQST
ncbi:scopoletin glucosyltransferase-like [Silene latifolia]|uniref:scopoletin glucosyltransferase-like n=1 Tax=Silene latifolia TaxID=37657 RepID=UPI003D77171D